MAASSIQPRGNQILDELPARERRLLASGIERVGLISGELLCSSGGMIKHVYFPRQGVISLFATETNLPDVGVGLIRDDGMFGLGVVAGQPRSRLLAVAQGGLMADRVEAKPFFALLGKCPTLAAALVVYGDGLAGQLAQNVACLARHPVRQRLARWMLDVSCGNGGLKLRSTQEAMAVAIAVLRPAVSIAAAQLKSLGTIDYRRGEVTILDRRALQVLACRCTLGD